MRRRKYLIRVSLHSVALAALFLFSRNSYGQPPGPATPATGAAQAVLQENGSLTRMPLISGLGYSRKSGLGLTIDTHWSNGYGYRPMEIEVFSPKPTGADHAITIQLHFGYQDDMTVEQDFEIKSGASKASTIVAVPTYGQMMNYCWWDVWVDGAKDLDLSLDKDDAWRSASAYSGASVGSVQILVASPDANHRSLVTPGMFDFEILSWKLADFPQRWIDYTCLDVISLSIAELQQLAKTNPLAFEAVERWVRSGGQLWVTDVGDKLEQLPQVSKLLRMSSAIVAGTPTVESKTSSDNKTEKPEVPKPDRPVANGWGPSRLGGTFQSGQPQAYTDMRTGRTRWTSDPRVISQLDRDPNFVRTRGQGLALPVNPDQQGTLDSSQWYVEQRLGLGYVWAFRGANEAQIFAHRSPVNASVAANTNPTGRIPPSLAVAVSNARQWEARHGIVPEGNSPDYAKYMLPNIGRAPVTEFQVLISLFVLIIGPLNYWLLKRFKRLQMLVLTVPLAAGFATAALFAYAVVSDGFGTTVRARSVTMIDQRSGEATCWARLSYYSGMAPGHGLLMPTDVAMYPVYPNWSSESDRTISRDLTWADTEGRYTRGWLMSRTPTQYLTVRARKTPNKIDIVSGAGKMQVTNRLGTRIDYLAVINDEGTIFTGDQLVNEARTLLQPVSHDAAGKQLAQIIRDHPFEPPPELAGTDRDFSNRRNRNTRRMYGRYRQQTSGDQFMESLIDRTISDLAGLNGQPALNLPPRTYVAVTASGPEVETGIENFEEDASFHVIVGQW